MAANRAGTTVSLTPSVQEEDLRDSGLCAPCGPAPMVRLLSFLGPLAPVGYSGIFFRS